MISRRQVLAAAVATAGSLAFLGRPRVALAAAPTDRRCVVVILRGGADGLALVPAPGDPNFGRLRGKLARQDKDSDDISLDGTFALHPKLTSLARMWREKHLAIVHAAQTGCRDRSQFVAQDILESGLDNLSGKADGWLNRALGYFEETEPRIGLAAGFGTPLILYGQMPVATWGPRRLPNPSPDYLGKLLAVSRHDAEISGALEEGIIPVSL